MEQREDEKFMRLALKLAAKGNPSPNPYVGAVIVKDGKVQQEFDLKHCKGCGICANECLRKAISMLDETKARAESGK